MRLRERVLRPTTSASRVRKGEDATATPTRRKQGARRISRALAAKEPSPCFLQRSRAEVEADPNRNTRILSLPKELVCEIASHLPIESVVCFSLTCKEALDVLGNSTWQEPAIKQRWFIELFSSIQHRQLFLQLLRRDLAHLGFTVCLQCNSLHPPFKPPRTHRETKLTRRCLGQGGLIDYLPHYSLVLEHIRQALESSASSASSTTTGLPIDSLSGNHTTQHPFFTYTLFSSARRIDRNLILRHDHIFRPNPNSPKRATKAPSSPLRASDVLSLPLRLCPHQTTSTAPPPPTRWTSFSARNAPLLTHAIASAFPPHLRGALPRPSVFRDLTPLEQEQVAAADAGVAVVWRCRGCPTKFRVVHKAEEGVGGAAGGELVVTAWHCFGKDDVAASRYWKMFVRREGERLGKGKRNSEFYTLSKSVPDFKVE